MIAADIFTILQWWFMLFLLGIGFLPLSFLFFGNFFDKGYLFARLFGMVLTTYVLFLIGVVHLVRFTQAETYTIALGLAVLLYIWLPQAKQIIPTIKKLWRTLLLQELLFLCGLFFWAYVRANNPDIHGLEKYMDFGFINSILRSDYFPPKDMWFTPLFINYYYFGHMITAVLTQLADLPAAITYNVMIATVFAFCFTASLSIGANLFTFSKIATSRATFKRILTGLLTAALVTFGGNLHILYAFFKQYPAEHPVPLWQLAFQPALFPNGYWYPNATRFIYNTIHEFPIYSWVVADLHGHVLDIPFVLLLIALLLALYLHSSHNETPTNTAIHTKTKKQAAWFNPFADKKIPLLDTTHATFWYLPLLGFLLSVMYMTNAWDGAIYLLLTSFVLLAILWGRASISQLVIPFGIILICFILFTLPYNIFFQPFVSGIGVLCAPDVLSTLGNHGKIGPFLFEKAHCQHSPWWQLLTLYGFFLYFIIGFFVFIAKTKKLLQTDKFVLLLIILGILLIIIPEFIYVKDIYPAHYRANTMFKLVFQAFIMLSIASAYIFVRISLSGKRKLLTICYSVIGVALISVVLLYPYQAITSYYGKLETYKGLDGTLYLKTLYPTDYAAIQWLNENIIGQPVILESQGDSYTDHGRVSTNTGLPTVLGWTVHEWLWRGTYDMPAPRIEEVKKMYETPDSVTAHALLKKYNVQYVFIGTLERQKYPLLNEEKFNKLGKVIYQNGATKIYQIN